MAMALGVIVGVVMGRFLPLPEYIFPCFSLIAEEKPLQRAAFPPKYGIPNISTKVEGAAVFRLAFQY